MYVILVYDVNEKIVSKVMKTCRIFLNHIQNSVFEGEITESQLMRLKNRITNLINPETDSIILFKLRSNNIFKRDVWGLNKENTNNFI